MEWMYIDSQRSASLVLECLVRIVGAPYKYACHRNNKFGVMTNLT